MSPITIAKRPTGESSSPEPWTLSVSSQTTPPSAFIKRHPVLTYYVLTFAISWSGFLWVFGAGGLASTNWQSDARVALMGVLLLAGPSIAGLLLTGLVSGRAGFRELGSRLLRWRVGAGWYAVALVAAPLLAAATTFALSLFSPVFLPAIVVTDDKASLVSAGIAAGLLIGIFEELGWTGFAIPRLRVRYGVVSTGLMLGVVWGAWHFPMFWQSGGFAAALPGALLLARLFSWLPAFRLLMVWLYERTGSLLMVMLMHASLVASTTVIFGPVATAESDLFIYVLGLAAVMWVVVAAVAVAKRGHFARQSLRMRVA